MELINILVSSWLSALCSLLLRHPLLADCRPQHRAEGIHTGTELEVHPMTPHWTGPNQPTTAWTERKPEEDGKCTTVTERTPLTTKA